MSEVRIGGSFQENLKGASPSWKEAENEESDKCACVVVCSFDGHFNFGDQVVRITLRRLLVRRKTSTFMKKIKQYDSVEIQWLDSLHDSGWEYINGLRQKKHFGNKERLTQNSVGYFIEKNDISTVVIQSFQQKMWEENDRSTDARLEIPNVAILKIRKLK